MKTEIKKGVITKAKALVFVVTIVCIILHLVSMAFSFNSLNPYVEKYIPNQDVSSIISWGSLIILEASIAVLLVISYNMPEEFKRTMKEYSVYALSFCLIVLSMVFTVYGGGSKASDNYVEKPLKPIETSETKILEASIASDQKAIDVMYEEKSKKGWLETGEPKVLAELAGTKKESLARLSEIYKEIEEYNLQVMKENEVKKKAIEKSHNFYALLTQIFLMLFTYVRTIFSDKTENEKPINNYPPVNYQPIEQVQPVNEEVIVGAKAPVEKIQVKGLNGVDRQALEMVANEEVYSTIAKKLQLNNKSIVNRMVKNLVKQVLDKIEIIPNTPQQAQPQLT
jgi:hypothetical protein